jgi:hypothetical protein
MTATAKMPKVDLSHLDPLVALILSALPSPTDEQKDGVGVGEHALDLDIRIRVRGELRVGPATTTRQVNKLKPWNLVKLLADKVSKDDLQACLDTAIAASKAANAGAPAVLTMEAEADDLKARVEAAMEQAGDAVLVERRGGIRLVGDVDVSVRE